MLKKIFLGSLILIFVISGQVLADFPVSVTDDLNHKVTLEKKPTRIISLAPANTEFLFALGLEKEIVGVTTYANYPKEALEKEKIGTVIEPNIEKIVSLEPELILSNAVNKLETVKRLRELGYNVAGFNARTVDEAIIMIKKVAKLAGREERGREIVTEMYLQLAEIKNLVDNKLKVNNRPRVFYEIWNDPLYTAGKNTFINDIVHIAGGVNIGAKARGEWPQYSLEKLLIVNPDIYISSPHSAPHKVTVKSIKNRANYQTINAVKNNKIYILDQDIVSRPSPRIIEGIKEMTKAIFPDLADEINNL